MIRYDNGRVFTFAFIDDKRQHVWKAVLLDNGKTHAYVDMKDDLCNGIFIEYSIGYDKIETGEFIEGVQQGQKVVWRK